MKKQKVKIYAFSTKTKGIKISPGDEGDWVNFDSDNSKYSSDQMGDFMKNNLEKEQEIELEVIENGDKKFTAINLNSEKEEKDFKKGSKVEKSNGSKEKNINRAVALKASVELNKDQFPSEVATEEVISIAQRFEQYLKGDRDE